MPDSPTPAPAAAAPVPPPKIRRLVVFTGL